MKLKTILIAGGIGLATLGAVGAATLSADVRDGVTAGKGAVAMLADYRHGKRGRGGMMRMICSDMRGERVESAIAFAESFMAFTPEQRTAWDGLTAAVRAGNGKLDDACAETKELRKERSLPARLALMETMMTAGADVLGEVRPAFDGWYATLNEQQREALDGLMKRHRHGRHGRGG